MKKIILGVALVFSVATFAQKDELKTLNKISSKSNVSEKDYKSYLEALSKGQSVLEVIDGAIYEVFGDGTKKKIKNVEASIKVDITKKIVLS